MSTPFEITGQLIVKDNTVEISASFKKREFVIEVINERNTDYNDFIKFQLTQDKCSLIDNINLGDEMKVSFNIKGRKWEKDGKTNYFSNLEAWRVEKGQTSSPAPQAQSDTPPSEEEDGNKLPF